MDDSHINDPFYIRCGECHHHRGLHRRDGSCLVQRVIEGTCDCPGWEEPDEEEDQ